MIIKLNKWVFLALICFSSWFSPIMPVLNRIFDVLNNV